MIYAGIDPGKKGAIAIIDTVEETVIAYKMPLLPGGKDLDVGEIAKILWDVDFVTIEKQQVMRRPNKKGEYVKQGAVSAFSIGYQFGLLKGICKGLNKQFIIVRPQDWKKVVLHGTRKDKAAAIEYVENKYPYLEIIGGRKVTDGVADAVCLAEYGKKTR